MKSKVSEDEGNGVGRTEDVLREEEGRLQVLRSVHKRLLQDTSKKSDSI